jgi:hypothetical protein
MRLKFSGVQSAAVLTTILTTTILCGSPFTAHAGTREDNFAAEARSVPTREEAIDQETDRVLYRVNPELNGRKLRSNDGPYIKEWQAIRQVVAQEMNPKVSQCAGDQYWELASYDGINGLRSGRRGSPTFDRIADAIFYSRHPELGGRKISASDDGLAREWITIRQTIMVEQPCS